ncbi:MAG: hypothetical protein JO257_12935 [Deltaproteobacteria bacterium]|nr:hypothetical protein [Deltaproteobacteria bacterium]
MAAAACLLAAVAGCGRLGFDERGGGDAAGGGGDTSGDGPSVTRWSRLTAYTNASCGIYANNVYCWGDNGSGQIGVMTAGSSAATPQQVPLPAGTVRDLSMGDSAACAIVDTDLWCWGSLGAPAPTRIALGMPATAVSVGHGFQCAIATGAVCWGTNTAGQLGTGDNNARSIPSAVKQGGAFVAIEAGDDHACALDASNAAWCWGHNDDGAIALPIATNSSNSPVAQPAGVTTLPQIAGWHTCALSAGTVRCWGEGDHGELGNGGTSNSSAAVTVTGLAAPTAIATGGGPSDGDASCAIDGSAIRCWGNGFFGRLGQGTANQSLTPVTVVGLPAAQPLEVAIGDDHACAALDDGSVWCWGRGDAGQLGDGRSMSSLAPVRVVNP